MNSKLIRAISKDGSASICAIDSTEIVRKAFEIHTPSPVVTAALGRVLSGASMLGAHLKGHDQSLSLQIRGDGPVQGLIAVSDYLGNVKGYALNPHVTCPEREDGKLDVSGIVGKKGIITVIKDLRMKEPYIGKCQLKTGEIAEDITSYLALSEQIPSVCALGVLVGSEISVLNAGGFLVQLLPFADEEVVVILEKNIEKLSPVTTMLKNGFTVIDIIKSVFENIPFDILDESQPDYLCDCSRERFYFSLSSLGYETLTEIINDRKGAQVCCHFCNTKYDFSHEDVEKLLNNLHKN